MKNVMIAAGVFLLMGCGGSGSGGGTGASATSGASSAGGAATATEANGPVGRWRTACSPNGQGQHARVDMEVRASDWSLDYATYPDATCSAPFLSVHIEGPWRRVGPSTVAGAENVEFGFTRKAVTAHNEAAVGFARGLASCGEGTWAAGVARDISASGCAPLGQRPIASCGQDFDLMAVDATSLRFGQRPADNDLCTEARRPAALATMVFSRQ
jgi:hypothetical protein